jgi:hypothetical protein
MTLADDGYYPPMLNLRKRFIVTALGVALAFGLVACDSDDPSVTTTAPGSETTGPVGS